MPVESSFSKSEIWLERFARGRITEMMDLKEKVKKRQGQLPSQRVPHHMRRRAVSHNPNRLPQRLRDKHVNERISGGGGGIDGSKPKRPNRRYRRRPAQLLSEYNRRQARNGIWLETHIWHAKRFHMTPNKWGIRLPDTPNDKGYRLAYRATKSKTLMFDLSYYRLFELIGNSEDLIKGLNSLLPPHQIITTFPSTHYRHLHIYEPLSYPFGYIGPISLHTLPQKGSSKSLWIWAHPSYADKVLAIFISLFSLQAKKPEVSKEEPMNISPEKESPSKDVEPLPKKTKLNMKGDSVNIHVGLSPTKDNSNKESLTKKLNVNEMKLAPRNVSFERVPQYSGPSLILNDLSFSMNRYRLIGPHADRILKASLEPSNIESSESGWWNEFYSGDNKESPANISFHKQVSLWKNESSSHNLPDNVNVIGLTVRDPRVILPPKRSIIPDENKAATKIIEAQSEDKLTHLSASPLWDPSVREQVSYSKCPDHVINEKRSRLLVPGTKIPLTDTESRIPIVLIRRRFGSDGDYGDGWDMISPAGWGLPFWMCFVMYGARTGGQRELINQDFERGFLDILRASPDSLAGEKEAEENALLDKEVYFRYPPDKRCNFRKTGFASPFLPNWKCLISDWIREGTPLVKHSKNKLKPNDTMISRFYVLRDTQLLSQLAVDPCSPIELIDPHCLVPVSLSIIGKGTLSKNAGIFLPTQKDMELFHEEKECVHLLREPLQDDKEENCLRNSLKTEHNGKKINLRRKWKRVKEKLAYLRQKSLTDKSLETEIQKCQTSLNELKALRDKEVLEFDVKMKTLWLDEEEASTFKDSSTRPVCGYVLIANYSLRRGGHMGIGFVTYAAMKNFNKDNLLLIRDNNSLQYRFVKMSIIRNNDSI